MSAITSIYNSLVTERDAIQAKSAPLRAERQSLREKITPELDRIRELDGLIHSAEQPRLRNLHAEIQPLQQIVDKEAAKAKRLQSAE